MAKEEKFSIVQAVRNLVEEMLELEPGEKVFLQNLTDDDCIAIVSNQIVSRFQCDFYKRGF